MTNHKKTNWRKFFFNWHMWIGIAFAIPILLVSLTAILIAHENGLGTKEIAVNTGWFPGYESKENINHYLNDVKSICVKGDTTYFGTKLGVIIQDKSKKIALLKGSEGKEIRDFLLVGNQLWIASKEGLFLSEYNEIRLIKKGNIHGIDLSHTTLITSESNKGYSISYDNGKTWKTAQKISENSQSLSLKEFTTFIEKSDFIKNLTMEKLILDIHTGKAFFGNNSKWIWIDLISISLLIITFAGIWMWYKRKFGKKRNK